MTPDEVVARIDRQELVDLALALGKIDSPTGNEGPAGQFVFDWLIANGFEPRKYAFNARTIAAKVMGATTNGRVMQS